MLVAHRVCYVMLTSKFCTMCVTNVFYDLFYIFSVLSEDEFAASSRLWRKSSAPVSDMVKQLANDGYNLDLQPDDSDLDLIPPRPLNERRCLCCYNGTVHSACSIQ